MSVIGRWGSSGGGGSTETTNSPLEMADVYTGRGNALDLGAGFSTSLTTISIPTGKNLIVHAIQYKTDDQTNTRWNAFNFDGTRQYIYHRGDTTLNLVEKYGSPMICRNYWSADFETFSTAPAPADHQIWIYGELVNE